MKMGNAFELKPRVYLQKIITRTVYVEYTHKLTENHLENIKYIFICCGILCIESVCECVCVVVKNVVWNIIHFEICQNHCQM